MFKTFISLTVTIIISRLIDAKLTEWGVYEAIGNALNKVTKGLGSCFDKN